MICTPHQISFGW